jgi:5-(carboxyamino)imidazole ribonucleotide synthase
MNPIGILGDGQLALLLAESAKARGLSILGYGEDPNSSFARAFPSQFVLGTKKDATALHAFAQQCSVLTLENEFYSSESIKKIESEAGVRVIPDSKSYQHFENKIAQHQFFESLLIAEPRTEIAAGKPDETLTQIETRFQYPVVLKRSQGGYDGYGVRVVSSREQLTPALKDLAHDRGEKILIQEKVAIAYELAQGILCDGKGNFISLPLVETIQRNGICEIVLSRPTLAPELLKKASSQIQSTLEKIAKSGINGLFHFEFFVLKDGSVLINEGAPRPHNSQHLSIDACDTSQFDLLVRYLAEGKLPSDVPKVIPSKPGAMINLLGQTSGSDYTLSLPEFPAPIEAYAKLYQKKDSRPGRKMGHLNLIDESGKLNLVEIARNTLKEYRL